MSLSSRGSKEAKEFWRTQMYSTTKTHKVAKEQKIARSIQKKCKIIKIARSLAKKQDQLHENSEISR